MENLSTFYYRYLRYIQAKDDSTATPNDKYMALSYAVRSQMVDKWINSQKKYHENNPRRVYYLSTEYVFGKNLKYIGYYFPLTAPFFWARYAQTIMSEAKEKLETIEKNLGIVEKKLESAEQSLGAKEQILWEREDKLHRLERIIDSWPDVRIIAGIIDLEKQKETLTEVLQQIDDMKDHKLAQVLENMRQYADDVIGSVGPNGNYDLFKLVVGKVSQSDPDTRPETYFYFLWLLSDVFRMPPNEYFTRQVQKDMVGPLKNAIGQADKAHLRTPVSLCICTL